MPPSSLGAQQAQGCGTGVCLEPTRGCLPPSAPQFAPSLDTSDAGCLSRKVLQSFILKYVKKRGAWGAQLGLPSFQVMVLGSWD